MQSLNQDHWLYSLEWEKIQSAREPVYLCGPDAVGRPCGQICNPDFRICPTYPVIPKQITHTHTHTHTHIHKPSPLSQHRLWSTVSHTLPLPTCSAPQIVCTHVCPGFISHCHPSLTLTWVRWLISKTCTYSYCTCNYIAYLLIILLSFNYYLLCFFVLSFN